MKSNKSFGIWYLTLTTLCAALILSACAGTAGSPSSSSGASTGLSVVATENFYGDIAQQLGAGHISVTSILSDPNVDPHDYESTVQDGKSVSEAQLVIENGDDYDPWMDKLLSASPNPDRLVVIAADVASHKLTDNPHLWYGIDNIQDVAKAITADLKKLDAAHTADYDAALATFLKSLDPIQQKIDDIKTKFGGTPVGLTETIFLYQTGPTGLNVLTPLEFQKAIAEGNDPPADTVVTANNEVTMKQIKVLIYNVQTITPITTNLENEAKQNNIPIVPVSETMPIGKTYQSWMQGQLDALEQALGG
ncbi:MAG TPA: zinc ABC transporter substrate-binding protein [Anaerolineales bacterium]|nr:zinc ABC transporter substrate-binding protein [Anaerolineales bacterium]